MILQAGSAPVIAEQPTTFNKSLTVSPLDPAGHEPLGQKYMLHPSLTGAKLLFLTDSYQLGSHSPKPPAEAEVQPASSWTDLWNTWLANSLSVFFRVPWLPLGQKR
jgi:hypothetical protein